MNQYPTEEIKALLARLRAQEPQPFYVYPLDGGSLLVSRRPLDEETVRVARQRHRSRPPAPRVQFAPPPVHQETPPTQE